MGKFTLLSERTNGEPSSSASLQDELELLEDCPKEIQSSKAHDTTTAPLIMRDAYIAGLKNNGATQYGVLGKTLTVRGPRAEDSFEDDRLYVNTNAPFSAIVCGVQGSGKSHTVSVLLENMFISGVGAIGTLQKPLSGLILHYGEGGSSGRPLCLFIVAEYHAKNIRTARESYSGRASMFHGNGTRRRGFFVHDGGGQLGIRPLYIQILLSILRDLGENFTYSAFQTELDSRKRTFNPAQVAGLEQRMSLLKAFMFDKKKKHPKQTSRFAPGQITIIDLSDPFTDSASACGLFEIIVRLFTRAEVGTGKVLVVDEAHKYLTPGATSGLTQSLLRLVQPTAIPPVLLDLCMISIMHRFSSPAWWDHLVKHVSADFSGREAFDKVVTLGTGEALIIAPSALGCFKERGWSDESTVSRLGRRYMIMKTRARVTADGGASLLVI
ncbi:hypothetical protein PTI98_004899 [Pleurotus ostreatus]|nr:hypothetical protein PTI98_004899 [Pleurotus ostreatus]